MLVLKGVPSASFFVLSPYTGRSNPPVIRLADVSSPLNSGLTFR